MNKRNSREKFAYANSTYADRILISRRIAPFREDSPMDFAFSAPPLDYSLICGRCGLTS